MSPLARVATLPAMAIGGIAVIPVPATAASPPPSASPAPSAQDKMFLQQAHQINLAEIATGKMAQKKGNSQTVKNLGAMFVSDHMNLDKTLMPVAQKLYVKLPSTPNSHQQSVATQLAKQSGSKFDTMFVKSEFDGHTMAIKAAQTEIAKGTNPDVMNVARQSLPMFESHRKALQDAGQQLRIPLPTATPMPGGPATMTPGTPRQPAHT